MTTEYRLLHAIVNHESTVLTFIYSIFERDAANELIESETIMTLSSAWRAYRWFNGRPIPKQMFSTRFY